MVKIAGVEFNNKGKMYYFNTNNLNIKKNIDVIVETEKGLQFGKVVTNIKEIDEKSILELRNIIRIASKDDYIQYSKNIEDAKKALEKAIKLTKSLELDMNFTDVTYTFDRNQLIFYFLSEKRVDFRELAKQLASIYKTRIELRQIGVRDKAKEISGIGQCGRELCCASFLNDLDTVSINMAKNQNIALNPSKINGLCGRLLCCLNYEDELYTSNRYDMPDIGDIVNTEQGEGKVIALDILNKKYTVEIENYGKLEIQMVNKCDICGKCNN